MSGVDTSHLEHFSDKSTREIEEAEEKRVTHTMKVKAEKNMTDAQRKALDEQEKKRKEEEEHKRLAAEKLERKRREAEERLAAQRKAAPAVETQQHASADKLAAAADLLKFAVDDKLKAQQEKEKQKTTQDRDD
jgi:hypothetical protein